MSIRHALLGFLSVRPLAGWDLKQLVSDSGFLPWSGNNNQIYRTLVDLHREGLVSLEVLPQERLPPRKVYQLADPGRAELRRWLLTEPEPPTLRSTFLLQLAWADLLSAAELESLLERYQAEIQAQHDMSVEQARRGQGSPGRTPREVWLWERIFENRTNAWRAELAWLRDLREGLTRFEGRGA